MAKRKIVLIVDDATIARIQKERVTVFGAKGLLSGAAQTYSGTFLGMVMDGLGAKMPTMTILKTDMLK